MTRSAAALALLGLLAAVTPAAVIRAAIAAPGFAAGQWEHHTQVLKADVPGVPEWLVRLAAGHGSRTSCNGQAQLASHPEELLKGDDTAICRLRTLSMTNGQIVFDTFCTNKHFPDGLLVSSHGTYTPTSYAISTISTGTKNGKPVRIETTGAGKRTAGRCSAS